MRLPDPPLLLVTDRKQARAPLADILEAAFAAGCRWASIRENDLPYAELLALRDALAPMAVRWKVTLTIHGTDSALVDHDGIAGLHLPSGADIAPERAALGADKLLGLSVHSPEEAAHAAPAFVDYLIAGPAFETMSKPGYGPALGAEGVRAIAAATRIPVIAIGGIMANNVAALRSAGAAGVAVMGGVMRADDPAGEVRALIAALEAGAEPRSSS